MGLKRVIVRNVLSNWTGMAVFMVVTFFLSPFVVHTLGNEAYGIWVLVGSLTGYFGLLDFGIRPTIVKFTSKYQALDQPQKINEIINSALVASTTIGCVVAVAAVVLSFLSPKIFKVEPEFHAQLQTVIILVGMKIALDFPFAIFRAVYHGLQRFDLNNFIRITVFLLRSLAIVVFLKMGGGLIALGIIILVAGVLESVIILVGCYRILPTMALSLRLASRDVLKSLLSFSAFVFIIGVAAQLSFYSSSVIIGAFLSASAITFYGIAGSLMEYLKNLVSQVTTTLTPVASGFGAHHEYDRLRKLLLMGSKYCLLIILPVGYVYLLMGETFINLWMGPEYGPRSSGVLTILMISYFGFLTQLVSGSILLGLGRIKLVALANLSAALANIILCVILVKPYGILGVAVGTTIPLLAYGTFFMPIYICRVVKIKLFEYVKKSILPPLIVSLPFLASIFLIHRFVPIGSLTDFILLVAAAMVLYSVFVLFFGLEPEHRGALADKVINMRGAGKGDG